MLLSRETYPLIEEQAAQVVEKPKNRMDAKESKAAGRGLHTREVNRYEPCRTHLYCSFGYLLM
jgi:hypothetical protein